MLKKREQFSYKNKKNVELVNNFRHCNSYNRFCPEQDI